MEKQCKYAEIYIYIFLCTKVVHFCAIDKINFIGFLKYVLLMYTETEQIHMG